MCVSKSLSFILIVQALTLSWGGGGGGLMYSYIMSTRDVSGLKCDARGHKAPKGGVI